ncbi:hypothetical protein HY333_00900 [Candidatus Collierbacteria bacterium]|nr:hypothetical protein [Candidatus Collierbacteria bacterium]
MVSLGLEKPVQERERRLVGWLKLFIFIAASIFLSKGFFVSLVMGEYYRKIAGENSIRRSSVSAQRGVIVDKNSKMLAGNIKIDGREVRFYPEGEVTATVTGYLGEIGKEELDRCQQEGRSCEVGSLIGKDGLEKWYEGRLSGTSGAKLIEHDASGKILREIITKSAVPGEQVKLNLDLTLQRVAYNSLKEGLKENGKSGVVVVSQVNGEVLALVSLPSYDPNLFTSDNRGVEGGDYAERQDILNDNQNRPLFNRAVSGVFAPGSVYKLVPAIAGLSDGTINSKTMIVDEGEIVVGEYRFGNWYYDQYGGKEGEIGVERAIARSNDIFFYKLGEMLGVDILVSWSKRLGLGSKTGIDLPAEAEGLVPSPVWREKEKGERWFLGNTYHMSIGQGDLLTTPIQINRTTAAVVSGRLCKPRIWQGEKKKEGVCEDLEISKEDRNIVIEGMKQACSPGGTAFPLFEFAGSIACKTGTAQHGSEIHIPHAWISVVIPKDTYEDDESLVITVLVEEGGEGSKVAAPIAKRIVEFLESIEQ